MPSLHRESNYSLISTFVYMRMSLILSLYVYVHVSIQSGHLSSTGQCFDVGMSVRGALAKFNPVPDQRRGPEEPIRPFPGSVADWAAGNGCLMRNCPIPLFFHKYPAVALDKSVDSCMITHGSGIAKDSCRFV